MKREYYLIKLPKARIDDVVHFSIVILKVLWWVVCVVLPIVFILWLSFGQSDNARAMRYLFSLVACFIWVVYRFAKTAGKEI